MFRKTLVASILAMISILQTANAKDSLFQRSAGNKGWDQRETTMDLFGSLRVPENKDFFDGRLGVGLGANYFLNSFLGFGADTTVEKFDWPNQLNASVIGRYPIEKWDFAPYLFAGGGRQFHDTPQWMLHIGGGVDYRWNRRTGAFLDVRRTFPEESRDFTQWRLGIRYRF